MQHSARTGAPVQGTHCCYAAIPGHIGEHKLDVPSLRGPELQARKTHMDV